MALIFIQPKYQLEDTSNFNTCKARVLSILEEHDLDAYVTSVSEEILSNVGRVQEQVNMHHFCHFQEANFMEPFLSICEQSDKTVERTGHF